jgi:NAD(P)-dependent dehydrogenase (short-subunit alcohol dehydrogenase family)
MAIRMDVIGTSPLAGKSALVTGGVARAIQADSANPSALTSAVNQTVEGFGRLDILVNNAAILSGGLVDDDSLEDFDRMLAVNVVQPGPTETDNIKSAEMRDMLCAKMALGRVGTDREVASLVAYLASPEKSFVTGSAITSDGGYLA